MTRTTLIATLAGFALSACTGSGVPFSNPPDFDIAEIETDHYGRCYGHDVTPALTHTRTAQELVSPEKRAADGTLLRGAVYQTTTHQQIVRERQEVLFETVCPDDMSVEFVASLQRALTVRGYFSGRINGTFDQNTREALQTYQRTEQGIDSPLMAIQTARILGLVALTPEQLGIK